MGRKGKSRMVWDDASMYRLVHRKTDHWERGVMQTRNQLAPDISTSHQVEARLSGMERPDSRKVVSRSERYRSVNGMMHSCGTVGVRTAPTVSREGMRTTVFIGLVAAVVLVMGILAFTSSLSVQNRAAGNEQLRAKLTHAETNCVSLQTQLSDAQSEINYAYSAKDYGLVSAGSMATTVLQAPQPEDESVLPSRDTHELPNCSLATILGY